MDATIPAPAKTLEEFRADLRAAATPEALEALRTRYLGKKSPLKAGLKALGGLPPESRAAIARELNDAVAAVERELLEFGRSIEEKALAARLGAEWQDMTMPGAAGARGAVHPLTVVERRCMAVMRQFGFVAVEGPEVEHAYYNFDALNIPENHPARDMQDTFWVTGGLLLRSHTTTVQARVLKKKPELPVKIACLGRAYRNEAVDATHLAMFHQFEGLWVDRGLTFAHLKGLLLAIAKAIYGAEHEFRFKPKYYPYTVPSLGMDLRCASCAGDGCGACHGAGWVTILGAGMVHPKVFQEFGYDPGEVGGLAFGLGISRIAAQAFAVPHMKALYEQDLRVHRAVHRGGL
jgi:phenylalanyl-tRNA synthetase alpha chain